MNLKEKILNIVTEGYLNSFGFNGVPIYEIAKKIGTRSRAKIIKPISGLIQDGKISLNFGDLHPNPHIKALKEEPIEIQLEKFGKPDEYNRLYICVYPTSEHMKGLVDPAKYKDTPFELRLALAEPQLSFLSFDLSVLEFYRNDPRYYYTNNDVAGTIYIRSEHEKEIPENDQMFLDTFGFSYDSDYHRAVAVFFKVFTKHAAATSANLECKIA